jgi:hypothetical protein
MSSMLEQAILDAKELKEAAIRNAQQALIEKYSGEFENEVEKLLEQVDPMAPAATTPVDPALNAPVPAAGAPTMPGMPVSGMLPVDPEKAKADTDNKSSIFDKLNFAFKDGEVIEDKVYPTGVVEIDLDSLSEFSFSKNKETPEQMALQELKNLSKKKKIKEGKSDTSGSKFPYDSSDTSDDEDLDFEDEEDFDEDDLDFEDEDEFEEDEDFSDLDDDELEDDELEDDDEFEDDSDDDLDDDFEDDSDDDLDDDFEDDSDDDLDDDFEDEDDLGDLSDDEDEETDIDDGGFELDIEDEDFDIDFEDGDSEDEEEFSMDFDTDEEDLEFEDDGEEGDEDFEDEELEESEHTEDGMKLTKREALKLQNVADRIASVIEKADGPIKSRLQSSYRELMDIVGTDPAKKPSGKKEKMEESIRLDWKRNGPRSPQNGMFREEAEHDYELEQLQAQIEELEQDTDFLKESNEKLKNGLKESIGMLQTSQSENKKLNKKIKDFKQSLQESRLMNYRLLYTNKALTDASLNERQKNRIAESISEAKTAEEVKLLYETLYSTMREGNVRSTPKSLSEAVERRSSNLLLRGTQAEPKKQDSHVERMQRLAGLK